MLMSTLLTGTMAMAVMMAMAATTAILMISRQSAY
jgi:hypothetical protein